PSVMTDSTLPTSSTPHAKALSKSPTPHQTDVPPEPLLPKDAIDEPLITTTASPTLQQQPSKSSSPVPNAIPSLETDTKVNEDLDVFEIPSHALGNIVQDDDDDDDDDVSSLSSLASDMFESMDIEDP
ncbi:hypothetical protein H4R35_007396, partial [Dimargaris xerosporica]